MWKNVEEKRGWTVQGVVDPPGCCPQPNPFLPINKGGRAEIRGGERGLERAGGCQPPRILSSTQPLNLLPGNQGGRAEIRGGERGLDRARGG